jgi:hypothetical protein
MTELSTRELQQLGALKESLNETPSASHALSSRTGWIAFGFVVGVLGTVVVHGLEERWSLLSAMTLIAGICGVLWGAFRGSAVPAHRRLGLAIDLHEDGIVVTDRRTQSTSCIPFDEIVAVNWDISGEASVLDPSRRPQVHLVSVTTNRTGTVRVRNDYLTMRSLNVAIYVETLKRMLPKALLQIDSGHLVGFDPFSLSTTGVHWNGKCLSWDEMKSIDFPTQVGRLGVGEQCAAVSFWQQGKFIAWHASTRIETIRNWHLFLALIEVYRVAPGLSDRFFGEMVKDKTHSAKLIKAIFEEPDLTNLKHRLESCARDSHWQPLQIPWASP